MELLWTTGGLHPAVRSMQRPSRRHQAAGQNGRQEDAAEMGPTEARSRKRWMKDDQDLRIELRRLWDEPVETVPIIIGALGTLPKSLKRNLEELGNDVSPLLLQK